MPGKINRIRYAPYNLDVALKAVEHIGKKLEPNFRLTKDVGPIYEQLIKYMHADESFNGDLTKGVLLSGATGTGKTLAMRIMSIYSTIDGIKIVHNQQLYDIEYCVEHTSTCINEFVKNGYEGLEYYRRVRSLCIDDMGSEVEIAKYYGNNLDVIGYIINERYLNNLLTFGTTNLSEELLTKKYGERIVSRMHEMFNLVVMKGNDFRKFKI